MNPSRPSPGVARRIAGAGWMIAAVAVQACGAAPRAASSDTDAAVASVAASPPSAAATVTQASAAAATAEAVVTALYEDHFAHEQNWTETYRRQRALFAPELTALLDADARAAAANADEIVGLDFDPLTDAQDTMTRFEVAPISQEGDAATVGVMLLQDTTRSNVRVMLARSGEQWRVTNLQYAHGDLASLLRRLAVDRDRSR